MSPFVAPLTREECVARLSSRGVARVSVSMDALPVVVPVVYVVDGNSILFRSPMDGALAAACDGAVIAFEVDDFATSVSANENWSVHMLGVGARLDDADQLQILRVGSLAVNGREVDQVVRLPIGRMTGHRRDQPTTSPV